MSILPTTPPRQDDWAPTRWSVVSNLDQRESPEWQASWSYLVETYRGPMERYARRILARHKGRSVPAQEAAEVVQDFLATCVEKRWLSRADPEVARFRAYVQVLLRRFAYGTLRHAAAQRRNPGEGHTHVQLDEDEIPAPEEQGELDEFARDWVQIAVDRALARLKDEHVRYHTVVADLIATDGAGSDDLASRVNLTRPQLGPLKTRARKRFCKLFGEELAHTVGDQEAFDDEWRAIRSFLPPGV